MTHANSGALRALIENLDRAVALEDCAEVGERIKSGLSESILSRAAASSVSRTSTPRSVRRDL